MVNGLFSAARGARTINVNTTVSQLRFMVGYLPLVDLVKSEGVKSERACQAWLK